MRLGTYFPSFHSFQKSIVSAGGFISLLFFLCEHPYYGQQFNHATHIGAEKSYNMVSVESKYYYLEEEIPLKYCCIKNLGLVCRNGDGKVTFKVGLRSWPHVYGIKLIKTNSNELLAGGGTFLTGCDIGLKQTFLAKIDTAGNVLFNFIIDSSAVMVDFQIHPQGDIYTVTGNHLIRFSSGGLFVSKVNIGVTGVKSLNCLNNGRLLLSYVMNNVPGFRVLDINGQLISDAVTTHTISRAFQNSTGDLIALSGTKIHRYDSGLSLVETTDKTLAPGYRFNDITLTNDLIYATGIHIADKPFYMYLSKYLSPLFATISNCPGVTPTGLAINKHNKLGIITTGRSSNLPTNSFVGFFQTTLNGEFYARPDVGVAKFVTAKVTYPEYNITSPFYLTVEGTATIKNYGNDTITKFHLNHYAAVSSNVFCLISYNTGFTLTLPPGGTVAIPTGSFMVGPVNIYGTDPGEIIKLPVCLFTTVPDDQNDRNNSNDYSCDTIMFASPVIIHEFAEKKTRINVFPVPFSDELFLETETTVGQVQITDALGRELASSWHDSGKSRIKTDFLPAGVYFLRITNEEGVQIHKLLKVTAE